MPDTLTTSTLESLRESVRNATGPDRDLDHDLAAHFHLKQCTYRMPDWIIDPPFTSSIDSCVELIGEVLPGHGGSLDWGFHNGAGILKKIDDNQWEEIARSRYCKTPPLALLEALLTALIEKETAK